MKRMNLVPCGIALAAIALTPALAAAVDVRVTITNLAASDGVAFSPVVLAAHNGSVDLFDAGAAASAGVEDVAEMGSVGAMAQAEATGMQGSAVTLAAAATSGGFGPGILVPGAEASYVLSLDPTDHRYLSYLSMAVPSNDTFIGNDNPTAIELFDAGGNFVGADFQVVGGQLWDAGTEVNGTTGAAYIVGSDASLGAAEGGVVHLATDASADLSAQYGDYLGLSVPTGGTFETIPGVDSGIVSFSFAVVPEPAAGLLGLLGVTLLGVTRRVGRA